MSNMTNQFKTKNGYHYVIDDIYNLNIVGTNYNISSCRVNKMYHYMLAGKSYSWAMACNANTANKLLIGILSYISVSKFFTSIGTYIRGGIFSISEEGVLNIILHGGAEEDEGHC